MLKWSVLCRHRSKLELSETVRLFISGGCALLTGWETSSIVIQTHFKTCSVKRFKTNIRSFFLSARSVFFLAKLVRLLLSLLVAAAVWARHHQVLGFKAIIIVCSSIPRQMVRMGWTLFSCCTGQATCSHVSKGRLPDHAELLTTEYAIALFGAGRRFWCHPASAISALLPKFKFSKAFLFFVFLKTHARWNQSSGSSDGYSVHSLFSVTILWRRRFMMISGWLWRTWAA